MHPWRFHLANYSCSPGISYQDNIGYASKVLVRVASPCTSKPAEYSCIWIDTCHRMANILGEPGLNGGFVPAAKLLIGNMVFSVTSLSSSNTFWQWDYTSPRRSRGQHFLFMIRRVKPFLSSLSFFLSSLSFFLSSLSFFLSSLSFFLSSLSFSLLFLSLFSFSLSSLLLYDS